MRRIGTMYSKSKCNYVLFAGRDGHGLSSYTVVLGTLPNLTVRVYVWYLSTDVKEYVLINQFIINEL